MRFRGRGKLLISRVGTTAPSYTEKQVVCPNVSHYLLQTSFASFLRRFPDEVRGVFHCIPFVEFKFPVDFDFALSCRAQILHRVFRDLHVDNVRVHKINQGRKSSVVSRRVGTLV